MYPKQVVINEKNIDRLTATYRNAQARIQREILTATDFGVSNRQQLLAQIDTILAELDKKARDWIEDEIPTYYINGAEDGIKQLKNIGAPIDVASGYNRIHQDAILGLIDDTAKSFRDSMDSLSRSGKYLLGRFSREAITMELAEGMISGKALRKVRQQIKGKLMEEGVYALRDRGGNTWTLDRYANMLFRTKAVEARNRGIANRLVENGYDLVQVSAHLGSCPQCSPWEGKILSASGATPGYPTVLQAERGGLFHPNCRHAINVLIPSLARMTRAYDPTTKTLGPAGASIDPMYTMQPEPA